MRHVYPTREVAHIWNAQSQDEAYNPQRNVSFKGATLFSYLEPIARILDDGSVLMSDYTWSITTSRHQSLARQACSNRVRVSAPYLGRYFDDDLDGIHRQNLAEFRDRYMRKVNEFEQHPRRKSCLDKMASIASQYNTYSEHFQLHWPELTSEAIKIAIEAERVEREAAARIAEEQAKARIEERRALEERFLPLWRAHQHSSEMPHLWLTTALRLSQDRSEIETTHGARVPVEVAPTLWKLSNKTREFGADLTAFPGMPRIGHFTLTRVEADGTLHVGCHTIPFSELELIATALGYLEKEAA